MKYQYSLKMLPHFNDDTVNFSSPEYASNRETQCKTKKTPEELKMSLAMAKKQASYRDVKGKLTQNPKATTTFEDLTWPLEAPMASSHRHIDTMGQGRQYFISTVSDESNSSSRLHGERGRQCLFPTGSDVAKPSTPLHDATVRQGRQCSDGTNPSTPLQDETNRRGRQFSSSTVSDVDSENTNHPPVCSKCKQCRGSLSCVHCNLSFCKRCYQDVHKESCRMAEIKECSQHPGKILEYWCDQDQEAICSDCGLIGSHKRHDVSKLEQRNEEIMREMLLMAPKVAQVLETLVESKEVIKAYPKEEMEKIHGKVSAYFKDQKDELQRKEDVMHLQVKQSQKKLASDCNNQVSEIDKHITDLQNLLKNVNNCLKSTKNMPFIDVNGNILDTRMLHEELRKSSLLPCHINFEEPFCKIYHDCLELNYTKPDLQPLDSHSHQTTLKVNSEFEEKSQIKIEDNHETLVQNNEDVIEHLIWCNVKKNTNKVESEIKCQNVDDDVDDISVVKSDELKLPVQDKRDLYYSDTASLSKVSMTNSNDARSRIIERMKKDERSIVLENVAPNVKRVEVGKWAERWGKVEDVFKDKSCLSSGKVRVIFKRADSARACLAAGKWTFNGTEINVAAPINNYTNSIYCPKLSKTHSSSDLLQYMNKFGTVVDVRIHHHRSGDLFAIVSFSSEKERDLAVAYKSHRINGRIIIVNVYGDRSHLYGGCKQSVDTKRQISSTKEIPKTNVTLISLSKSPGKDALDESQEKEGPLSSSTPLETSIICEVGKASFKNPYVPEVHRTYSGKIVPANTDLESNGINAVNAQLNVDKTSGSIEPILNTNKVTQIPEKEISNSSNRLFSEDNQRETDLEVEFYASPAYSEAQLTNDGWVRPVMPADSSLEVKVTHIDATGTVWVVPLKELKAHRFLSKILTDFCEDLISSPDSMTWRPGQRAVVFHEGLHERVEILKVATDRLGSKMTAILVDNGKTIHCRGEELLIAPRSGVPFTYPSLAMPVRLYGISMNASLDQIHIEKVMSRVRHRKCTLALAWTPRNFPIPGTVRYTDADCPDGLAQSGNVAEDLINLGCGSLVVSFNDWMYDMSLCDVGWMLDESYFGVDTTKAIPSTLPLRAGQWIPCKAITMDDEVRMVGLLPRVEDLGNSTSSLSLSILEDAVNSAQKRMALYGPLAEAEDIHLVPTVGENVLVFSDGEWCRARVAETTDDGPWVVLVDYIYQEQVKPEHIRKVPVDGGLDEYWHLDPVHAIRASWPLTGTETQTDLDLQKDLLLSSVEYFKVVGFKEISFDDEKHEVVGHFYDQNKRRLI